MTREGQEAESIGGHTCVACGGAGAWSAARQALLCQSCGTAIVTPAVPGAAVDHFPLLPRLRDRPDSGRDWQPRVTHLRCRSCQSLVVYDEHVVGRTCDACGMPGLVPSDSLGAPVTPSGVLPFRTTEAEARTALGEWLRSKGHRRAEIDTVRALYLPCWVFNASVSCRWRGERQRTNSDGVSERIPVDGIVERTFDDYFIPASRSIDADRLRSIAPFPIEDMRPYDTQYLAGSIVETYTTNMWDAWDAASGRMQRELDAQLREDSDCPPSSLETWPEWRDQRCAHLLVPAYLMTYRHGKDVHQAAVNGWTGKAAASVPFNGWAALLVIAVLLTIVAAVVYGIIWLLR